MGQSSYNAGPGAGAGLWRLNTTTGAIENTNEAASANPVVKVHSISATNELTGFFGFDEYFTRLHDIANLKNSLIDQTGDEITIKVISDDGNNSAFIDVQTDGVQINVVDALGTVSGRFAVGANGASMLATGLAETLRLYVSNALNHALIADSDINGFLFGIQNDGAIQTNQGVGSMGPMPLAALGYFPIYDSAGALLGNVWYTA